MEFGILLSSRPSIPIQTPVLNCLREMLCLYFLRLCKIRDCPRDFQDAIVRTGAEIHVTHGELEHVTRLVIERAKRFQFLAAHARIAREARFARGGQVGV